MLELGSQDISIPGGKLGEFVIGEYVGADLIGTEVIHTYSGHFGNPCKLGSFEHAMTGDDHAVAVSQYWLDDAECLEARGDPANLELRVDAAIVWMRSQTLDRPIGNHELWDSALHVSSRSVG